MQAYRVFSGVNTILVVGGTRDGLCVVRVRRQHLLRPAFFKEHCSCAQVSANTAPKIEEEMC